MATNVLKTIPVLINELRCLTYLPGPLVHCWWWDKEDLVGTVKYLLCLVLLFIL